MPWFVLYTKSRNEKLVADKLNAMGIEAYCPTIKTKRRWSDRVKMVEEPLIRSYCFVRLAEHERNNVFTVAGIVRYMFWLKKPAIVKEVEIETIKWMLGQVDHDSIHVKNFSSGATVKIDSGSFIGEVGQVKSHQGKSLSLYLESLQVVITVDLSRTIVSV